MKRLRLWAATIAVILGSGLLAYAAGQWPTLPIVGGASYCASTATGATGGTTCTATVPAGPVSVTGNELVPADTRAAAGLQTVLMPMAAFDALPVAIGSFGSGQSQTVSANVGKLIISPNAGTTTFTNLTIQMPASPIDGQRLSITSTAIVFGTFLVSPNTGQTVNRQATLSPMTGNIAQDGKSSLGVQYIWNAGNTTWYRLY